ncbi:MAG: RnfABCDGE type electron transport complex subunit A [Deltaproteobacteria bacterium]|nr:RnfABCDGE type electron transport complex subunit A [Deltaproteobacteria bacterium]
MVSNELTWYMILMSSILINNIVLIRFLALCSFFGVSNEIETSIGMGMAVIFVMTLASASTWILWYALLLPLHLEYLRTAVFILVIAGLVQFVEMYMKKALKSLYNAMGIYLPLITTNCAVLAIALLNIDYGLGFVNSIIYTVGVALGYTLAIILFAGIKERLALSTAIPTPFRGHPIAFITASLMSLAFLGFSHLFGL